MLIHVSQPVTVNGALAPSTGAIVAIPTVTPTSAYASGAVVGGVMTFNNVPLSGVLETAHIKLGSVQTAEFRLYLFSSAPVASNFSDFAAPAIAAADITKVIGLIDFTTSFSDLGTHTFYELTGIGKAMTSTTGTIYGVLVAKAAVTFTTATDILGVALVVMPG